MFLPSPHYNKSPPNFIGGARLPLGRLGWLIFCHLVQRVYHKNPFISLNLMMLKTKLLKIVKVLYILIIALFLLDHLDSFDIKSQGIKSFIYYSTLLITPLLFIYYLIQVISKQRHVFIALLVGLVMVSIIIIGPMKIIFSSSSWKTQNIVYKHGHLNFKTVEYQMQDIGAFGYNKRTVEVLYLTPWFTIISPVINDIDKRVEWIRVDEDINELGLKMP